MPEHFYRPAEGHRLAHDPFNSIIAPRPIGWIGSLASDGRRNLAPYSFFNALNYRPPLIGFSSNGDKHTVGNCRATGEFTWNLVTRSLAARMNQTSTTADVDEFTAAGLDAAPSREIAAPRVAASPVSFECVVTQIVELQGADATSSGAWFVVGEVVGVHLDDALVSDGVFDTVAADPLLRGGGPSTYFFLDPEATLHLHRPD